MTKKLKSYIARKIKLLADVQITTTFETFKNCENEIQVDNIAHTLIINKRGIDDVRK